MTETELWAGSGAMALTAPLVTPIRTLYGIGGNATSGSPASRSTTTSGARAATRSAAVRDASSRGATTGITSCPRLDGR